MLVRHFLKAVPTDSPQGQCCDMPHTSLGSEFRNMVSEGSRYDEKPLRGGFCAHGIGVLSVFGEGAI